MTAQARDARQGKRRRCIRRLQDRRGVDAEERDEGHRYLGRKVPQFNLKAHAVAHEAEQGRRARVEIAWVRSTKAKTILSRAAGE
eukprot:2914840-Rhodomonas_salina.1